MWQNRATVDQGLVEGRGLCWAKRSSRSSFFSDYVYGQLVKSELLCKSSDVGQVMT